MFNILHIFKAPDLRKKVVVVLLLLAAFRLLAAIPIPGVNTSELEAFFASSRLLGFLNIFSGGGLSNLSLVMLGIGPYITAVIVMQLLMIVFPRLKEVYYEEGPEGRAKFNRISRYLTIPFSILQGYSFLNLLMSQGAIAPLPLPAIIGNIIIITAGTMFLVWIGEVISEYKIGNGTSLIIFAGIVSGLPRAIMSSLASYTPEMLPTYIIFVALSVAVIAGITYINEGERKISVSYAKRVRGNKLYGGVTSYLPLKINQAGVIPIIFAVSLLLLPQFAVQIVAIASPAASARLNTIVTTIFNNQLIYSAVYFALVVVFTYFYTAITFNPDEISKTLQQSGGFLPGIRPGAQTTDVLRYVVRRITLFGALFLGIVAVLPNLTQMITGVEAFSLGGTGLLIVVAVALEVMKQLQSQLSIREYETR
ncbi:preprotein translocase subunit SecY [Candidatus Jorgensenbacteria bacterium GWA1_54_12]|uniref:Protein translocase subunit SecY n=1 Tax=Candidatus Jorgensenbacteria bacterium GWA1_54_12 TaxID=1798468 RepID=A0A1F6BL49_9BACT|nr:MAG: preprotein translocase subunit SecY [Candidatus Jorgensenbacteria bacterium GWA1_54_12]